LEEERKEKVARSFFFSGPEAGHTLQAVPCRIFTAVNAIKGRFKGQSLNFICI
jgi:hypothetical protein